jgi:hypothetical protein
MQSRVLLVATKIRISDDPPSLALCVSVNLHPHRSTSISPLFTICATYRDTVFLFFPTGMS